MGLYETRVETLGELKEAIDEALAKFPEYADEPVMVQDDDGIYESQVIAFDLANGPWLLVDTRPSLLKEE